MWPGKDVNPMASRFMAARAAAANVPTPGEQGSYSPDMFYMDFPQFTKRIPPGEEGGAESVESLVPEGILNMFVDQANDSVLPSRWGSMWRYAAGLYTAHFAALYLKTWSPGSDNSGQAAISYDNSAVTAGTEKWGSWNATQYGSQLVTMARLVGMGGMYAI